MKWNKEKQIYFGILLSMLFLSVIFLNSFHWPYEEISKRKVLVWIIVFFNVVVVPIILVKVDFFYCAIERVIHRIKYTIENIKEKKKKIIRYVFLVFIEVGISFLVTAIIGRFMLHTSFNIRLFYTMITSGVLLLFVTYLWKNAAEKPENVFVVIALIMGVFCISITPCRVGVSWDDEIHYARTLEISNALNGIMYQADEKNIVEYGDNIYSRSGYDRETDSLYREELETLYASKAWNTHEFTNYNIWSVGYIPSAIGIMIGRGLGLSYTGVFNMGRVFNLFMYVWLLYMAIRRIRYGKVLIAAIGLIPTTIFMATNYAYDPWVTGFLILGFAYFFGELQDEKSLDNKNILIMVGAIILGCMPKATYFLLLFPLMFMPKKKFKSAKQRKYYYLSIIGAGLFLVATFMLPILISGPGTGDYRGGSDVNATEQIKFILQNPLAYAKILLKFELDYISLGNAGPMLQRFAYVGEGYLYSTVGLLLAVLAFLDRGEDEKNHLIVKGTGLVGCIAAIVLSTTALYISFTPVACGTILGMQGRYLVPTIYPALYSLGIGGTTHKINKNAFVCVPMLLIAITFVCNMFKLCVLHY